MTIESRNVRHIVAVAVGNALEWYDFAIYGDVAVTISKLFFPPNDRLGPAAGKNASRPVKSPSPIVHGGASGRRQAARFLRRFRATAAIRSPNSRCCEAGDGAEDRFAR